MIARAAADTIMPLTFLAFFGHCFMQRIQEIQSLESAVKLAGSMACTGQVSAHAPHFTRDLSGFGTRPAPPAFSGYCRSHLKTAYLCSVPGNLFQTLYCHSGRTSAKRRHGNQNHILPIDFTFGKISFLHRLNRFLPGFHSSAFR